MDDTSSLTLYFPALFWSTTGNVCFLTLHLESDFLGWCKLAHAVFSCSLLRCASRWRCCFHVFGERFSWLMQACSRCIFRLSWSSHFKPS